MSMGRRPSSSRSPGPTGSECRPTPGITRPAGCAPTPTTARPRPRAHNWWGRRSSGSATAVLNPFDITIGILTPDEAAAFAVLPNPLLAAGLCRGYNDWLIAEWLEHEPRLRGLLVVTPQHPEAAAAEIRRLGERRRDRRRLPARRGAYPLRQPGPRPDLARLRRARTAGRDSYALRGCRHRRPGDRRGYARLLHGVPRADRCRDARAPRIDPLPRGVRALPAAPG